MSNDPKELDAQRMLLLTREPSDEVRKALKDSPRDPKLWYKLGMALSDEVDHETGIAAFSQGLSYNPFDAELYFGRGRKYIGLGQYWHCISDTTMSIRLDPTNWNHWYYRAIAYHLNENYEDSIADLKQIIAMTPAHDHYPMVDWIFENYVEMGDMENAKKALDLIDTKIMPPTMDYGYRRRVMLAKEEITPEEFMDHDHIKSHMLNVPNRFELELMSYTYGLFSYYTYKGETEKANDVLRDLVKLPKSAAFGCIKGWKFAKERGIV